MFSKSAVPLFYSLFFTADAFDMLTLGTCFLAFVLGGGVRCSWGWLWGLVTCRVVEALVYERH